MLWPPPASGCGEAVSAGPRRVAARFAAALTVLGAQAEHDDELGVLHLEELATGATVAAARDGQRRQRRRRRASSATRWQSLRTSASFSRTSLVAGRVRLGCTMSTSCARAVAKHGAGVSSRGTTAPAIVALRQVGPTPGPAAPRTHHLAALKQLVAHELARADDDGSVSHDGRATFLKTCKPLERGRPTANTRFGVRVSLWN